MKKTLVALAAVSAVAAFAQTTDGKPGVQIQGLFSAGYQANSYNGAKVNGFDQNGSGTTAVNIRVLEDLGGGMAAYGRLENDFSVMSNAANQGILPTYAASVGVTSGSINANPVYKTTLGTVGTWGNGELAVGLRSPVGDFAFGSLNNSGLNMFLATVSPLQGTSFGGGYGTVIGADPTQTKVRWENSFRYISPTTEGFTGSFIYAPKQTNGTPASALKANGIAATTTSTGVGLNNQVGAQELGLQYANGPLKAAFVTNKTSLPAWCAAATGAGASAYPGAASATAALSSPCATDTLPTTLIDKSQDNKQTGLSASYTLASGWLLSAAMQKTTLGGIGVAATGPVSDRTGTLVNAMYTTGAHTAFVQVGNAKEKSSNNKYNGNTSTYSAFGYNYALSKNTALVARYETFNDQANVLGQMYPSDGPYSQSAGATVTGNTTRVRSMFGIHSAF